MPIGNTFTAMPGIGTTVETFTNEFRWGRDWNGLIQGGMLDSTTRDAGSTPTTTLRPGLLLGTIAASGKLRDYGANNTDGSDIVTGILIPDVNVLDRSNTAADQFVWFLAGGPVKPTNLYGFDENARSQMSGRFVFDDRNYQGVGLYNRTVAKPAGYTVVAADNGTTFTTTGATGAVTFLLPSPAKGLRYKFYNTVNQNMVITAPSGKLIGLNNATATTLTFSTSSQKIGAAVEMIADDTGSFWMAILLSTSTPTYS